MRSNQLIDKSVQKGNSIILSEAGQTGGVVLRSITEETKFMCIFFSSLTAFGSNLKPEVDQLKLKK